MKSRYYWNDPELGVKEIARVLGPEGVFCIADHIGPEWAVGFFGTGAKSTQEIKEIFFQKRVSDC